METTMEETKPAPAAPQKAEKPTPPSTEKGKFCACERDHGEDDVASLPRLLVKDSKTVKAVVDGKPVEKAVPFERAAKYGVCAEHGAGEEASKFKRTAEHWATVRGHLPHVTREAAPADKPLKVMPAIHNPKHDHYLNARFGVFGGVVGKEVTLEEYDAAVAAAKAHVFR